MFSIIESYADKSETIKEARKNVKELSFSKELGRFIILFFILLLAISMVQYMFYDMNAEVQTPLNFLFAHLSFIFSPILIYLYITKIEKRSLRSIGFSKGNAISSVLKGFLIGLLLILAIVIIGVSFGQFKYNGIDLSSCLILIIYFIGYGVQSFGEEIYCRGWALTYFAKRHSILFAIFASNIVFILPHLGNSGFDIMSIVNIFLIGILFAVIFLKYDNIWICGGIHTAWNFLLGPVFGLNVSGEAAHSLLKFSAISPNIFNGGTFGPESSLIVTFVVIVAIVISLYVLKK